MKTHTTLNSLLYLSALTLLGTACSDSFNPATPHAVARNGVAASQAASGVATPIVFDQQAVLLNIGGPWPAGGTHVGLQFSQNPHLGDAIIATFVWRGSTNTITTVTDHLHGGTPVGNTYTLMDYVTADGWSMATYVATDVRNFPETAGSPDQLLAVHAIFSDDITEGGEMISAYSGVSPGFAQAVSAHHGASGNGSTTTIASPGALPVDAGSLTYGVTMADAIVNYSRPADFSSLNWITDQTLTLDGEYALASAPGTVEPQWTWSFQQLSTWFVNAVELKPQTATHLVFVVQPSNTLLPGSTIAPAVQVVALDDQGNTVTGFTGPMTIAIDHDGSLLKNAQLSGTKTATPANGVATFSNLSIDQVGMGYTLQATATNLNGVTSNPFNVTVP